MKPKHKVVLAIRFTGNDCNSLRAIAEQELGKGARISLAALVYEIVQNYIQDNRQAA